jgi:hypothetical protein
VDLPTIDLAPIDSIGLASGTDLSIAGSTEIGSAFAAASLTRTGDRQTVSLRALVPDNGTEQKEAGINTFICGHDR